MFDLYEGLNKKLIYPLYYWKNNDRRLDRLKLLERQQYYTPQQLKNLQVDQLNRLVQHAYDYTIYYRKVMEERNLKPSDIKELCDIALLPVLTKEIIQNNLEDLISSKFAKTDLIKDASGGSTGTPTIFYKDKDRHNLRRADQIRHDRWCGWDLGQRSALIWGAQRDLKAIQSFREHIISRYIERRWELDAFEMTNKDMSIYTNELEKIKPTMILGYANALFAYANFLNAEHSNHNIRPRGIISSAETLTEEKREVIEQAFKCKVLNRYGSREVGLIASECSSQEGLHINADNLLVEILKEDIPVDIGQSGDIVVTDFSNFGMPFIRFKMEDRGYLKQSGCSCERTLPLLGAVEGRTSDFFISSDGSLVHGEYFTHLFYGIQQVRKFQLIQESLKDIQLKIVEIPEDRNNRQYLVMLEEKIHEILGQQAKLTTLFVNDIPPSASGKTLFTISKVSYL